MEQRMTELWAAYEQAQRLKLARYYTRMNQDTPDLGSSAEVIQSSPRF